MIRIAALPLLLLAACTPVEPPAPAPSAPTTAASPVLDAALLGARHWRLAEATAADGTRIDALFPRPDTPLQLDFADGRVSVSNACNRIGGHYTLDGDRFATGNLISTQMACADAALMQSDAAIGERLRAGGTLHLDGAETLVLATPAGETLRFAGTPTADAKYGAPGKRVFLEVAAQRVPCHHAMMPDYQCLHVREIAYDDQGLKQSEGEWQFLYQDIEGYTHAPGIRNVLRLKRYPVADPPADGASIAYVLDRVVESERVDP